MGEGTMKTWCTSCCGIYSPEKVNGDECSTACAAINLCLNVVRIL